MKLIFILRSALDTHSVKHHSCFTCKYYYVDPIDNYIMCELSVANVKEIHCVECDKYKYVRDVKKL